MRDLCCLIFLLLVISVYTYRYYRYYTYRYSTYRYRYHNYVDYDIYEYSYYSYSSYNYYYDSSSHAGVIAGGVIGGLVGLGILTALIVVCCRCCVNSRTTRPTGRVVMQPNVARVETHLDAPAVISDGGAVVNDAYKPGPEFTQHPPLYPGLDTSGIPNDAANNHSGPTSLS